MPVYIVLVGCYHSGTDGRTNEQTRKDRASQPMDHRRLRWAKMGILAHISLTVLNFSNVVKVNTNNHQHCIDKGSYQSEQKVWSKLLSHSSSRAFMVKNSNEGYISSLKSILPSDISEFLLKALVDTNITGETDFRKATFSEKCNIRCTICPNNHSAGQFFFANGLEG